VDVTKKTLVFWLFPVCAGYTPVSEKHVYNNSVPNTGKPQQQFADMTRLTIVAVVLMLGMNTTLPGNR
jgi:hypothetical protein